MSMPLPPLGATIVAGRTTFRVWAPAARSIELELLLPQGPRVLSLSADGAAIGLQSLTTDAAPAGTRYCYRLDGDALPDPCSRFQPQGVHGPSQVVDAGAFGWTDAGWRGVRREGLVIYELHTCTFTQSGTFTAIIDRLDYLRELGITAIELMPVADFPGERNWGYDGVAPYAPSRAYGTPDDLRRLVDAAHARGLGVLLDVVYNHLGPDGNYLRRFSPDYFTDRHRTPWGDAINYDGPNSALVREYVLQNAEHWVREYHLDGLRLDATHAIVDTSSRHLLQELQQRVRAAASGRDVVVIAESEQNDVALIRPTTQGGLGLDAVWADDFHHAVHTALTGEQEGYYADYDGSATAIARAITNGFLYQGERSRVLGRLRGTLVSDEPGSAFVFCIQNHDQVGNRALGERLNALVSPALYRVATALLLFAPETPLLFMGQEFAASAPFLYFTDHHPELGLLVTEGRRGEFQGFSAFQDPARRDRIPDPQADATFQRSRLDWSETERNAGMLRLYRDLLALRRDDPVLATQDRLQTQAAAVGERVVAVLRRSGTDLRLLIANLGAASTLDADDPVLAELADQPLRLLLSTGDQAYRLHGESAGDVPPAAGSTLNLNDLVLPAQSAFILASVITST